MDRDLPSQLVNSLRHAAACSWRVRWGAPAPSGLNLERAFVYSVMLTKQTPLEGTDWERDHTQPVNEQKVTVHGALFHGRCLCR